MLDLNAIFGTAASWDQAAAGLLLAEVEARRRQLFGAAAWSEDADACLRLGQLADAIDAALMARDMAGVRQAVAEYLAALTPLWDQPRADDTLAETLTVIDQAATRTREPARRNVLDGYAAVARRYHAEPNARLFEVRPAVEALLARWAAEGRAAGLGPSIRPTDERWWEWTEPARPPG
jgi:hypothetical protein